MFLNKLNNFIFPLVGLFAYIVQAIYSWPTSFKGMENTMTIMKPEIEQARETSGMLICASIMIFYLVMIRRRNQSRKESKEEMNN